MRLNFWYTYALIVFQDSAEVENPHVDRPREAGATCGRAASVNRLVKPHDTLSGVVGVELVEGTPRLEQCGPVDD